MSLPYVNTRIRFMSTRLLKRDTYRKLLKMDLPEITRFLEEMEYKKEIDELAVTYSGVDLIEYALNKNMAATFKKIFDLSLKSSRPFVETYLLKWDVWNVKMLLRGTFSQISVEEVRENLIPAGELGSEFLEQVAKEANSVEEVVTALSGTKYYKILEDRLQAYVESKDLAPLEDALDQYYYTQLLSIAKAGTKKVDQFVKQRIDMANTMFLLRAKTIEFPEEKLAFIPGGSMSKRRFYFLANTKLEEVKQRLGLSGNNSDIDTALRKELLKSGVVMLRDYRVSLGPLIGYFTAKETEVDNLRILVRGKAAGLPAEMIEEQLVM